MRLSHLAIVLGILFLSIVVPSGGECDESWDKTTPVSTNLYALWGTADQDIFSAGDSGVILHYNGTTWQENVSGTPLILDCLWGSSSDNVFAAGNGIILRNTGGSWDAVDTSINRINALWGSSGTDIFAVGLNGVIIHFDGIDWTVITPSATIGIDLFGLWGSAEDNVYAGGEIGNIFQFNGQTWQKVADGLTTQTIRALWGSSASDIFAAGDNGKILHFNGTPPWEELVSGTGLDLYGLWGSSEDDVFAAGEDGIILKFDSVSRTWSTVPPGVPIGVDIRGIWGSTAGNVYFACNDGTIIRFHRDDHIPPVVVSTSIMTISSGKAYVTTPVVFHFSEQMDASTITTSTITLSPGPVLGTVSLSSDGLTATLTPNDNLAFSTTYTATVTTGVKDAATAKNAMKSNFTLPFTTENKPKPEGSGGSGCFISSACM